MSASSSTKLDDVYPQQQQQHQQAPSSIVKFKVQSSLPVSSIKSSENPAKSAVDHHHLRHLPSSNACNGPQWNSLPLVALGNIYSYLDVNHRLKASSTCHSWRNVLFTSTLFPCRNFRVNLCSHKFTIPPAKVNRGSNNNNNSSNIASSQTYGFSVFALRSRSQSYGGHNSFTSPTARRTKRGQKSFNNEHLKAFLRKCAPLFTGLTVYFDPNSTLNVIDLNEIIKYLSENEVPIYDPSASSTFANCRNLKSFILVPVTPLLRTSRGFICLYNGLSETIRFLVSKCKKLEELCLGGLDRLITFADLFLEELSKSKVDHAIRRLHISSIKSDLLQYAQPLVLPPAALAKFTSLVSLSIDFDCLNSSVVKNFERLTCLTHLQINIHRYSRSRRCASPIDVCSWASLHRALPKLSATVNLLHLEAETFDSIVESLIASDLPIRHFRSYYLELKEGQAQEQMKNLLEKLYLRHGKHLETAVFVDHFYKPKKFQEFTVLQNPWVMFAWQCHVLRSLTIIGYTIDDFDLVAIARLRERTLRNFHFPTRCIEESKQLAVFDCFCKIASSEQLGHLISEQLKYNWSSTADHLIPELQQVDYEPQMTYQRTLLES